MKTLLYQLFSLLFQLLHKMPAIVQILPKMPNVPKMPIVPVLYNQEQVRCVFACTYWLIVLKLNIIWVRFSIFFSIKYICRSSLIKVCLHRLCNLFATGSRLEKNWNSRAVAEVGERFSSSRQPVADWNQSRAVFWTCTKDWPRLNSIAKGLHRSPNDCQLVADWSAIDRRPVAD